MKIKLLDDWATPDDLALLGLKKDNQGKLRMEHWKDKDGNEILNPRRLPYSKIGGVVIYNQKEIDQYLRDHKIC